MNAGTDLGRNDLFALQIKEHLAGLRELVSIEPERVVTRDLCERLSRGTKLLWGSCSILGLDSFKEVLQGMGGFFAEVAARGLRMNDAIGLFCGELMEVEEKLAGELGGGGDIPAFDQTYRKLFRDLAADLTAIRVDVKEADAASPAAGERATSGQSGAGGPAGGGTTEEVQDRDLDEIDLALLSLDQAARDQGAPGSQAGETGGESDSGRADRAPGAGAPRGPSPNPLADECSRLEELVGKAVDGIRSPEPAGLQDPGVDPAREEVETLLGDLERRVETLRRHVGWSRHRGGGSASRPRLVTFEEIEEPLRRFLALRGDSARGGVHVLVHAPDVLLEEESFSPTCRILEHLTNDCLERGRGAGDEGTGFSVLVRAWSDGDTIRVAVHDNGSNWLSENRIDTEDCLAFYPGLRRGRADLEAMDGLLWVEPRDEVEGAGPARFIFSVPVSLSLRKFVLLPIGRSRIALPQSALDAIVPSDEISIEHDENGQVACLKDRRIEVADLGLIHDDLPLPDGDGSHLAIFGSVDKRLGLLVDGPGLVASGALREPPSGGWSLLSSRCLSLLDGTAIPILEYPKLEHHFQLAVVQQGGLAAGGRLDSDSLLAPEGYVGSQGRHPNEQSV